MIGINRPEFDEDVAPAATTEAERLLLAMVTDDDGNARHMTADDDMHGEWCVTCGHQTPGHETDCALVAARAYLTARGLLPGSTRCPACHGVSCADGAPQSLGCIANYGRRAPEGT